MGIWKRECSSAYELVEVERDCENDLRPFFHKRRQGDLNSDSDKPSNVILLAGVGHRYAWHKRVPIIIFVSMYIEEIKFTGAAVNIGCLDRGHGVVAVHVD